MRSDAEDMGNQNNEVDEPLAPPIVTRLRVVRHVTPTFPQRVMDQIVRDAARPDSSDIDEAERRWQSWYRRSFTLTVTPLRMIALAAGICLVVSASIVGVHALLATRTARAVAAAPSVMRTAPATTDTVYVMRFVYEASSADPSIRQVSVVGDFNGWSKGATPLVRSGAPGVWTATVTLPRGRHEYAFVLHTSEGERWLADPATPPVRDEFGTETSVVVVGRGAAAYHS